MNELPIFEINKPLEDEGIFGISLVENPAIGVDFIAMSEEKEVVKLKMFNEEKRQLVGAVLIPNQLIPRKDDKLGEYLIKFNADVIENLSHKFINDGLFKNSWYNHKEDEKIEELTVVESWIKTSDDEQYGLKLPTGTWMIKMQLGENSWNEYIKTGKAKGFSIDGLISKIPTQLSDNVFKINNTKIDNMNKSVELLKKALTYLTSEEEEVKMATLEIDGVKYVSDSFAEGDKVFIEDENGDRTEAVSVTIENEGMLHTTDEDGVVISVLPVEEVPTEEVVLEETDKEEMIKMIEENEELKAFLTEYFEKGKSEEEDMFSKEKEELEEMKVKLSALEDEKANLIKQLEETPSTTKLSAISETATNSKLSFAERINQINKKLK